MNQNRFLFSFKSTISLLFFIFFCFTRGYAQHNIQGSVTDTSGKAIASVNVLLLKAMDSSLVKGIVTNEAGGFNLTNVSPGRYIVAFSHTGFQTAYSKSFEVSGITNTSIAPVQLRAIISQLGEVTVVTKKPFLEQKIDRLIINVANSITSTGNTALEVLERSPGITIDHQNSLISMNGKNGVIVMINGKISRMPASAIVQLLSGMSAGNIEKIELITTPPANFDAEGNAGYINIVLKENDNYGTNGSFTVTVGSSKGLISENNININHRKGKLNLYGDFSYSLVQSPFTVKAGNSFLFNGVTTQTDLNVDRRSTVRNMNGRAGADLQINKHTILGVLLSGYNNDYSQHENNQNLKYRNAVLDTIMKLHNTESNRWNSFSGNINLQHTYKAENKFSINLDYVRYSNTQPVNYSTDYFTGTNSLLYNHRYKSKKTTTIYFWVAALDIVHRISKTINMEAGLKSTVSKFDNDILFERLQAGGYEKDNSLSATYQLQENYSAAYASFDVTAGKKTSAKIGFRYEYSNSNLGSLLMKNIVDRHYGSLFPTLFFSHKLNDKNTVNFSYSRRITRPSFNDLAPFTYYVDPNTVITGNPALQPAFSNTVKFDFIYNKYFLSVSYSQEAKSITGFQPSSDSVSGKTVLSPENLNNLKTVSVALSVPISLTKWWTMQYNFTGSWQQVNAVYQAQPVRLEKINFQLNGNMSFVLPKAFSIELSGFYQSKSLFGIVVGNPLGSLDLGLKKKLPGKKGTLVFTTANVFNTLRYSGTVNLPEKNLYSTLDLRFTQRAYKLTYTKSFGKDKLKQKRDRATGAEDEKERVH